MSYLLPFILFFSVLYDIIILSKNLGLGRDKDKGSFVASIIIWGFFFFMSVVNLNEATNTILDYFKKSGLEFIGILTSFVGFQLGYQWAKYKTENKRGVSVKTLNQKTISIIAHYYIYSVAGMVSMLAFSLIIALILEKFNIPW